MPNIVLRPFDHASTFRRIAAIAWDSPRDPTIYGTVQVRAEALLAWLESARGDGEKLTVTHAVARAVALAFGAHPDLNAIVRWGRLYLRQDVDVFVQVAIPDEREVGKADLSGIMVRNADRKDIRAIASEIRQGAARIRKGEDKDFQRTKGQANVLPGWLFRWALRLIEFLQYGLNMDTGWLGAPRDPFGSAMVTSLGMMGIGLAYAPFFPLARCPLIVLVGAIEDGVVAEDGKPVVRKLLTLNATADHRIVDGFHAAVLAKEVRALLEEPSRLDGGGGT